ncbi:MAG: TonB-dependent receptor [Candidatus Rokubacteria bacterium]|nr:TonB-dependent receptor [Candidatus Rokubacteria bacterium]
MKRLAAALAAAALHLAAGGAPARAQAPPAAGPVDGGGISRLPAVRVIAPAVSGIPDLRTTPGTVDVLTGADVAAARAGVLPDALERLPGVTLQNEQGNRFQPTLSLRGFQASPVTGLPQGVSVFLDGVRLNEPSVEEVNFDLIPLQDVERIEVIRGPSVLFGRNTLGAVVSLVTRRGGDATEIVPSVETGSFGRRQEHLRLGGSASPFDYALSLTRAEDDGYRQASASRVSRVFAKLGLARGPFDGALSYQFSDDRLEQPGSLPQHEAHAHPGRNFTAGDFFAPTLHQAILNGETALAERLTLAVNAFVRALEAEQFNVNLVGDNSRLLTASRSAGAGVQLTHRAPLGARANVLIAGVEYTRHDVGSRTFAEPDARRVLVADLRDVQDAVGAYAQDALTVLRDFAGPRSALIVTLAGRWDGVRHDIDDRLGGPSAGVRAFDRFNPRAGLTLELGERLTTYASHAEGFRAPAFLELTCAGPGAVCPGLQVGVAPDPPLKAVVARSWEIGLRARPVDGVRVELAAFRTDVRDDIFSVSPTGTTGLFFENVGATRREGIEAGVRLAPAGAWETYANYTLTRATFQDRAVLFTPRDPDGEVIRPGNRLPLVPAHRVNAGVTVRPAPWVSLTAEARYVGAQYLRGDEANVARPLAPHWVADVGGALLFGPFEAFARVNNALNARHATFATFAVNGREPGHPIQRFLSPAPPINVVLGAQYRF